MRPGMSQNMSHSTMCLMPFIAPVLIASSPSQKTAAAKPTPVRTVANEPVKPSPSPAIKVEAPNKPQATPPRSGASYPPVKTSKLDVDARPIYEPNGKPITDIDMDAGIL